MIDEFFYRTAQWNAKPLYFPAKDVCKLVFHAGAGAVNVKTTLQGALQSLVPLKAHAALKPPVKDVVPVVNHSHPYVATVPVRNTAEKAVPLLHTVLFYEWRNVYTRKVHRIGKLKLPLNKVQVLVCRVCNNVLGRIFLPVENEHVYGKVAVKICGLLL